MGMQGNEGLEGKRAPRRSFDDPVKPGIQTHKPGHIAPFSRDGHALRDLLQQLALLRRRAPGGLRRNQPVQDAARFKHGEVVNDIDVADHDSPTRQCPDKTLDLQTLQGLAQGGPPDPDFPAQVRFREDGSRLKLERHDHLFKSHVRLVAETQPSGRASRTGARL